MPHLVPTSTNRFLALLLAAGAGILVAGCASSGPKSSGSSGSAAAAAAPASTPAAAAAPASANRYAATDGRTIEIGKATPANGGTRYDNPHMEKGKCWIAGGFAFTGYDTLYLPPTLSTAKFPDKPEDTKVHELARENLVTEISRLAAERGLFTRIVTRESDIPAGSRVLTLENTITEFSKGGGAARYFVGLYGGGQPVLRVQGKATGEGKTQFTFEARRSGTSAGARVGGVFMKDEDIQIQDIRSMALDLTDFMAAIAGKYPPKG